MDFVPLIEGIFPHLIGKVTTIIALWKSECLQINVIIFHVPCVFLFIAGLSSSEMIQLDQAIRETAASLVDDVIFRAKEMAQRCKFYSIDVSLPLLFILYSVFFYDWLCINKQRNVTSKFFICVQR